MDMETKKEIYDLLKSKLPVNRDKGQSFASCVGNVLCEYKELITPLFKNDENYGKVTDFINVVPKVIELYIQGCISQAYSLFKEQIDNLLSENENGNTGLLPVYNKDYNSIYELVSDNFRYYFRITHSHSADNFAGGFCDAGFGFC